MIRAGVLGISAALAVAIAACASEPPPPPVVVARRAPPPEPAPVAAVSAPIIAEPERPAPTPLELALTDLGVEKSALQWSPSQKLFAVVVPIKPPAPDAPRAHRRPAPLPMIAVYSDDGQRLHTFRVLGGVAPADLRFLGETRLLYLAPPKQAPHAAHGVPQQRYGLQAIKPGATPIACVGHNFVFSPIGDHLAWIAGEPRHQRVFADGLAVFPRRGATAIQGQAVWSNDGASLALIESARRRLVVLVEFDNPSGDNSWPLPAEAATDTSLQVFWAGAGKLVVGPSITKPVFATSFHREPNQMVSMPAEAAGGIR